MNRILQGALALMLLLASPLAAAAHDVFTTGTLEISGGYSRATLPNAPVGAGYITITNKGTADDTLVSASSPVAGVTQIHEMKMEGQVMRMRAVAAVPIQPGQPLELKPGGYHLMLMDLKAPLKVGTQVPVTLTFRDAKGATSQLQLAVPVLARAPDGTPAHKH